MATSTRTTSPKTYIGYVIGAVPPDLSERIAQAHAVLAMLPEAPACETAEGEE